MHAAIRITVLRRTQHLDLLQQYADTVWEPCERLHDGQQFIATGANMPEGFCSWA